MSGRPLSPVASPRTTLWVWGLGCPHPVSVGLGSVLQQKHQNQEKILIPLHDNGIGFGGSDRIQDLAQG